MSPGKPKVVIDTNAFIAAYYNPNSASAHIIGLCCAGKCQAVFSPRLRKEIELILKQVKARKEFRAKVREFFKGARMVKITQEIPLVMEDPDDNKFLNCALQGKADYLVTSDRHLLKLGEYLGTKICKPSQFLRQAFFERS
jgi:hypothetical protein